MKRLALLALVGTVLCIAATGPLLSEVYEVTLNNGNVLVSKYRPVDAPYDTTKVLIMTDVGNLAVLAKADIASIESDVEAKGFGTVIDSTTILIGISANDAPEPGEEGAEGEGAAAPTLPAPQPVGSDSLFRDPGDFGGGIPVSAIGAYVQPQQ